MKALAISYKGIEEVTALEIRELFKAKTEIKERCVLFDVKSMEDLALLCYKGQAVNRVLLLLDNFKIEKIEDLKRISKIDFFKWLKDRTFAVRCEIIKNELDGREVEKAIGDEIEGKVDLDNPDVTIFVYIYKNDCYIGIDFSGDLSKRAYKIYTHRFDLKGTIAYSLVRLAGFDGKGTLVNPFCRNGTIAIEATLLNSGFPVNYFKKDKFLFFKFFNFDFNKVDKKIKPREGKIFAFDSELGYIKSAKNNAKIAGVDKAINISKRDIDWLDTKFKEGEVDFIVANVPRVTRYSNHEREYKEFFNQAQYVLNKAGRMVLCCNNLELLKKCAEEYGFKITEEIEIERGKEILKVLLLIR